MSRWDLVALPLGYLSPWLSGGGDAIPSLELRCLFKIH